MHKERERIMQDSSKTHYPKCAGFLIVKLVSRIKKQIIVVNGKFLSQNITGVQRYAREIMLELDKIAADLPEIVLLTDKNAKDIPELKNIKVMPYGRLTGNPWEQISLPIYAIKNRAFCVSLCNMAPIVKPDAVVIHDISFRVNKSFFSKSFVLWYNFVFSTIIKKIKMIFTVSEFSKSEICRYYNISKDKIVVTYNGWQHFERCEPTGNTLAKYGLVSGKFFFSMSSMAPNKNFMWIAKAAKNNPDTLFVISGAINKKVFGDIFDFEIPQNLRFLGYVRDEEAKELIAHCRAFLFPSYYEGFGIPPLEALSVGAKVVVSDRSCMREIFGDHAYYISPDDANINIDKLISQPCLPPSDLLDKYSWKKSAAILHDKLIELFYAQ